MVWCLIARPRRHWLGLDAFYLISRTIPISTIGRYPGETSRAALVHVLDAKPRATQRGRSYIALWHKAGIPEIGGPRPSHELFLLLAHRPQGCCGRDRSVAHVLLGLENPQLVFTENAP